MINIPNANAARIMGQSMTPQQLVDLRSKAELTQHDLATLTGIARPNIAAMETCKRPIGAKSEARIMAVLSLGPDELASKMRSTYSQQAIDAPVAAAFEKSHLRTMRIKSGLETTGTVQNGDDQ